MKDRKDFVSNSSSSSFICTKEDLNGMVAFGERSGLNLRQYCDTYAINDVFGRWHWLDGICTREMKFVSDEELQESFGRSLYYTLPESAKKDFAEYAEARNGAGRRSAEGREKSKAAEQRLKDRIYDALAPKWKDVELVCVDASDDCGDEQSMEDEFNRFPDKKFGRVFNNH